MDDPDYPGKQLFDRAFTFYLDNRYSKARKVLTENIADDILDNITLSWLTNTGVSSARLYTEFKGGFFQDLKISTPAAVSVFPEEIYQGPRSWSERAYSKLIHYNQLPKGGHFAAWEQPELLTDELRTAFRTLR